VCEKSKLDKYALGTNQLLNDRRQVGMQPTYLWLQWQQHCHIRVQLTQSGLTEKLVDLGLELFFRRPPTIRTNKVAQCRFLAQPCKPPSERSVSDLRHIAKPCEVMVLVLAELALDRVARSLALVANHTGV